MKALSTQAALALALAAPQSVSAGEGDEGEASGPDPETAERIEELEEENEELREELEYLREDVDYAADQVQDLLSVKGKVSGYLDVGFFAVQGDGTGFRNDIGHLVFPEFDGDPDEVVPDSWVFMGDPLATAINARGDPAETGESRAIVFDGVDSGGEPTFLVNALNLQLFAGIGERLTLTSYIDFVPRSRDVSDPDGLFLGDFLDVKLAYARYLAPLESFGLELYAGKFDSVVGFEYRAQEAPDRVTVSPSLICRYVCGRPLGLKARGLFFGDHLIVNVAVTNGSHFTEHFGFADELDANGPPTGAGRLSVSLPLFTRFLIGASGAYGPQDAQPKADVTQWHVGADLHLEVEDLELTAEYVKGKAEGDPERSGFAVPGDCAEAACLSYQGAYGLVAYRLTNRFIPYARVDWRDAHHRQGASFVYISKLWRATAGLRTELGTHVIIKGEYTVNRELGRIPHFDDDFFTSSLVVTY